MAKSSPDDKILCYNDVVLRRSDLDVLKGPIFLNDRVIEFYLSYLSTSHPSPKFLLVPPSIAFWISNTPDTDSLEGFLAPLKFPERNLVIFPINDNDDVNAAGGGSHWSLLAYERSNNVFVHHDSSKGINNWNAKQLYKKVEKFLGDPDAKYIDCDRMPQQVNGYDCGVYVIAVARVICEWCDGSREEDSEGLWFPYVEEQITPASVTRMRGEVLELIHSLMAEK